MMLDRIEKMMQEHGVRITLQRLSGTGPGRAPSIVAQTWGAFRTAAGGAVIVGDVQQADAEVMVSSRQLVAAGFTDRPRHGDQVIYDGMTTVVQGVADSHPTDGFTVYTMRVLGLGV